MQKLSRSLIAVGGLALLAACGDDVSITPPPEQPAATIAKVDVIPQQITIAVGEKFIATASVTVNPGTGSPATTVTWSSADAAIASVAASGEVTGVAPGTTTIRATSTADPTKVGAAAVTVGAAVPATISIKSVTAGLTTAPVNFNNVAGQIDVTLNVDPGDQNISAVEILLDNNVVYSQAFSLAQSAEDVAEALAEIVGSIATHQFDPVTGAVSYTNGLHLLSARAQLAGGTSVATPSINLTFNNPSGWIAAIANTGTNTGYPASAANPTTGIMWTQGTHTLTLTGVNYAAGGVAYTNVSVNLFGVTQALTPNSGTQVFEVTYNAAQAWNGTQARLGNYLSAVNEVPNIVSSTLSNGQPGATTLLNSAANAPGLGITPLAPILVDNVGPGNNSANGVLQTAPTIGVMPIWVNAAFSYVPTAVFTAGSDVGVSGVTNTYYSIAGALPGAANSCTFTGMEVVTTGADLDATTVSTVYNTRVAARDGLGNPNCDDIPATNGADFVAPTIVPPIGGPADLSFSNVALGNFSLSVTDNASGFGPTPVTASITRVGINGQTVCVFGTLSSGNCVAGSLPLIFDATTDNTLTPTNVVGYYTIANWTVADQALNTVDVASRTYLYDNVAPGFSGGVSLQPLYTGGDNAAFNTAVTDDLDLGSVYGVLTYGGITFRYPNQSIGAYGVPLEQAATVAFNVANFMRCVNNAPNNFAAGAKASSVNLTVQDQAANATSFGGFAIPPANVENCDPVGATAINTFGPTTATFAAGITDLDLDGANMAATSASSVSLAAIADVPINTSVDPFSRVDFYWFDGTDWRLIGSANGVLAQTPTTRTYTYTFVWDPAAPVTAGAANLMAVGVDSDGDAVVSVPAAVNILP